MKTACVLLLLMSLSLASCSKIPTAEVTDMGLYDAVIVTEGNWKLGVPVEVASVTGLKHRETTNRIPAKDGIYWGMRGKVTNSSSRPMTIRYTLDHPELTSPDGTKESTSSEDFELEPGQSVDTKSLWYFIEGCEFEWVPGIWTHRIYANGVEVVRKDFEVYKAN